MDIKNTKLFYENIKDEEICSCAYCKNYIKEVEKTYPKLADYLESLGVDIKKPFETMPLEPSEGYIDYIAIQYIVLGNKEDFKREKIGDVIIETTESHPDTSLDIEHYVIHLYPLRLAWTME